MNEIPPATILIALAMLAFSVLIVSKVGGKLPLSTVSRTLLLSFGGLLFIFGLYLHLSRTPPTDSRPTATIGQRKSDLEPFTFTFSPSRASWGEQVEIGLPFSAEDVTVYLNGMPLPKKAGADNQTIRITIPSGAKTGYFEVESRGVKARAADPISISP